MGERASNWADAQRSELRNGEPARVLAAIRALPLAVAAAGSAAQRVQADVLGYLESRRAQLQYAAVRAQGLPIGSGIVESANKLVVDARLKGAGRRWAEGNVTPMVALRSALCSGRWDEAWATIAGTRCRRDQPPRPERSVPTVPAASAASVAAVAPHVRHPAIPNLPSRGPKTIVNGRPTARHPWKRFPAVASPPAKL